MTTVKGLIATGKMLTYTDGVTFENCTLDGCTIYPNGDIILADDSSLVRCVFFIPQGCYIDGDSGTVENCHGYGIDAQVEYKLGSIEL